MPITVKIIQLLSQKYNSNISILGDFQTRKPASILDTFNKTIFIALNDSIASFKDQNGNLWLTAIDSFSVDGQEHFPKTGDCFTLKNDLKYSFVSKEEVITMAEAYFEKHKL
ncbi:hypothetical protein [Flavobacterium sp.]|uniref:hypothetical protein n=1 Tax=Flavobacterium sp. TaxID=239 RepID=UPI0031E25465